MQMAILKRMCRKTIIMKKHIVTGIRHRNMSPYQVRNMTITITLRTSLRSIGLRQSTSHILNSGLITMRTVLQNPKKGLVCISTGCPMLWTRERSVPLPEVEAKKGKRRTQVRQHALVRKSLMNLPDANRIQKTHIKNLSV